MTSKQIIDNSENLTEVEKLRQENMLLKANLFDKNKQLLHTQ